MKLNTGKNTIIAALRPRQLLMEHVFKWSPNQKPHI